MKNARTAVAAAVAAAMMAMTVSLFAQESQPAQRKSEPIYGYRLMSDQERNDYRERMRNARSAEERQQIRDEHRKLMEARAKERGVALPEPKGPAYGPGAGKGPGYGPGPQAQGKGPGAGKGAGTGPGPQGEGKGYGPGGKGKGYGPGEGKGPGYGPGPRQ
jgi:hypothetical protein